MTQILVSTKAFVPGTAKMTSGDSHPVKHAIDAVGIVVTLGSLMQVLPVILTVLSIIWYLIRIGEWVYTKVKAWKGKKNA